MKTSRRTRFSTSVLAVLLAGASSATWAQSACERAWADYRYFKDRNTMAESQYPLTVHGAAVRAACGADALPVPAGADTPPRITANSPQRAPKPETPPPKPEEKPTKPP